MARRLPGGFRGMVPVSRRSSSRGFSNDLRNLAPDLRKAAGEALREATRRVISDLQEIGPDYSGDFKRRWYSQVEGRSNKVFASVGVPRFTDQQLRRGAPAILIGNTSPYAQEAMDLIPGRFVRQEEPPNKTPVAIGRRQGGIRGDIKPGSGRAISTAQLDWYSTYMEGGAFDKAFKQGAKTGFISPVIKPGRR